MSLIFNFQNVPQNCPITFDLIFFIPRSPSRSPTLGCSLDSSVSFESNMMAKGLGLERDNRILELNEKNIELERKILDLEENLREKVHIKPHQNHTNQN